MVQIYAPGPVATEIKETDESKLLEEDGNDFIYPNDQAYQEGVCDESSINIENCENDEQYCRNIQVIDDNTSFEIE